MCETREPKNESGLYSSLNLYLLTHFVAHNAKPEKRELLIQRYTQISPNINHLLHFHLQYLLPRFVGVDYLLVGLMLILILN